MFTNILKGFTQYIRYYLSKSYRNKCKVEAQRRIKICESCQFFYKLTRNCLICGCFMDIKTKVYNEECPKEYW